MQLPKKKQQVEGDDPTMKVMWHDRWPKVLFVVCAFLPKRIFTVEERKSEKEKNVGGAFLAGGKRSSETKKLGKTKNMRVWEVWAF
jgi:hypothetical protein